MYSRHERTLNLVLQHLYLRVCIVNELIHLVAERIVLFCQPFRQMLLINDLLRGLVAVEC